MNKQVHANSDPLLVIKSFLKLPDFKGTPTQSYWEWLVKKAKRFKTKPLSKRELKRVKKILSGHFVKPRAKQCFYYNQLACMATQGKLRYFEGQAISSGIPVDHAWLVYKGKVVDAIWGCLAWVESPDGFSAGPRTDYAGVEIPLSLVSQEVLSSGEATPLILKLFEQQS